MNNSYLKIVRLDHWIKQLFIIPGILIAIFLINDINLDYKLISSIILGIVGTCFIASANYVINEYFDAPFDKYHPTKKERPIVTNKINKKIIFLEYLILIALGLECAFYISKLFFITELFFILSGILYNLKPFRIKDIAFLDVLFESINIVIRLLLGWFIITNDYLPPISIVLGYWMFGAFLMAIKRYSEYIMFNDTKKASLYRKSFNKYSEKILLVSAVFYALVSIFFLGIFLIKYKIELLLCIPFLCFLFCYYIYISFNPDSVVQKPEKLYKEKKLLILLGVFFVLFIVLLFVDIPFLSKLLDPNLIKF